MTKAIRFDRIGGPDVLALEDVPQPEPGPGEIRVTNRAIGLNYIEIYFRSGVYPVPSLPSGLGKNMARPWSLPRA